MMIIKCKNSGMTLIELMISIAIVGILAAVAYPAYVDYYAQSYRSDVMRELVKAVNRQEAYYSDQMTYTTNMTNLGYAADPYVVENSMYTIDVVETENMDLTQEFELKATAVTTQKNNDPSCASLTINHLGEKSALDSNGNDSTSTCWY
ncbi:type IV pilin protein [Catenovulum agarivorans]|uniref:type IV pilin protein n=1 Tax=Catenovulum agarivorans TaxID=1172192 RepID=UPI000474D88F|nr:type IV pilin protein [Catenovulum agarivorans]